MSKKPQKVSPASQRSSNGSGGATEQAAAATQNNKRGQQQQQPEQAADESPNGQAEQRASQTIASKMTNENQEQPRLRNVPQAVSAASQLPTIVRPDRKRSRPSAMAQAQAHDQKVIKSEPGIEQAVELTKAAAARQRQRLQTSTEQVSALATAADGPTPQAGAQNICAACARPIRERYLLMALDKHWHEDCLKCACCDCRLGEVGSSLFTHSNKLLCRRDFLRIFGQHGHCAACKRSIPPYEMVMRANEHAYHMDCFACQQCQYRFCVGDRYHLTEAHKIICLPCHSEQAQQQRAHTGAGSQEHLTVHREPTKANLPTTTSPAGDHLSPEDDHSQTPPPPPPSKEFMGETSGSEPEVMTPTVRPQVAGTDSAPTIQAIDPPPLGHDLVELTNQRPAARLSAKREPPGEGPVPVPASSTGIKKRASPVGPPHPLSAATTTQAGQEQACVM